VKFFTKAGILSGGPGADVAPGEVTRTWSSTRRFRSGCVSLNMAKKRGGFSFERSARSLQENMQRSGPAAGASYTLIGAIILLGGIGYAVDRWLDASPWFLMTGLGLGIVVGFYELIKVAWHR